MEADTYNQVFTSTALIMVFLFIIPSIPATMGNFLLADHGGGEGRGVPQAQPR